ncbi:MAG TPA: hypothetical protein VME40_12570 [Caulobacteraceae bacterium]|nr:hypothetical protein [Caulobacteraceae bacterium]
MTLAETHDIVGAFREPVNTASQSRGSIHDDATASKLGFRGGTVAGSLHMDQFTPLALELFGDEFWRNGNLSFYFRKATVDREKVRALARAGEPHARLWMEDEAGNLIADGTGSCRGGDSDTAVQRLMDSQDKSEPTGLKILGKAKIGDEVTGLEVTVTGESLERRLETITERLPAYEGEHGILPPSMAVALYRGSAQEKLYKTDGPAVGLFGAIELQAMGGTLRADVTYKVRAKILALSESPKTENVWYRAWAADPETGEDIHSMLMYLRYMKGSSAHYA